MTVYVLFRHDGASSLVLGVFQRSLDARVYVQEQFGENHASWKQPRPGRQHWLLDQSCFTYSIEAHAVKSNLPFQNRLESSDVSRFPWSQMRRV